MDMQVRLTQFSHGGGCGCKIAPGVLERILAKTAPGLIPKELLVGIETSDDAAVASVGTSGLVTANAPGSANVSATVDGKLASALVTVTAPVVPVRMLRAATSGR